MVTIRRGFAEVAAVGDASVGIGQEGHLPRHVLLIALVVHLLVVRENREAGVNRRAPGEAGCDEQLVVLDKVGLGIAVATEADDAIEKLAVLVDRAADIER